MGAEEKVPACGGSGEAWRGAAGVTRHVPLGALRVGLLSPGQPFWFLAWRPPGSGLSRELGEEGSRLLFARPVLDKTPWLCRRGTAPSQVILALGPSLPLPELQEMSKPAGHLGEFSRPKKKKKVV